MDWKSERIFLYHADASPIGGVEYTTEMRVAKVLPTAGSASLAPVGGRAESLRAADKGLYGEMVSATTATSEIYGEDTGGEWVSDVHSTVTGFALKDVETGEPLIEAEKVVAHLRVRHPKQGYSPMVEFTDSAFVDLRILGREVKPTIDLTRFARVVAPPEARAGSWLDDVEMVGLAARQCRMMTAPQGTPEWVAERYGWMQHKKERRLRGHVVCSLVDCVSGLSAGRSETGHAFEVPGLGRLVLGELMVDQGSFSLTMLRAETRCRTDATSGGAVQSRDAASGPGAAVSVATAHSNGRPYP